MSTLPPLPPELQAMLNQKFPEVMAALDTFVTALRSDPKRDPNNLPDYHNTVTTMLMESEGHPDIGPDLNRALAALAFIELADSGWKPPERGDIPGIDIGTKPRRGRLKRRPRRGETT